YIFRGITQSNHKPSVTAYFEPRYNVTKDVQLYVGTSFESISFPNRAAAEVDVYGGGRVTLGAFAFDVGAWGYLYPGGTCHYGAPTDFAGVPLSAECQLNALVNGNVIKKDLSFFEVYGKVNYTFNDNFSMGGIGFTYKVFTLDLRYSDTNLSKGDCNAFTSDFSARGNITASSGTFLTPINPSGVGSNWCGAAGIVKLSADLTALTNLK